MIAAIIQARMTSTRLPEKILKDICGKPELWHVVTRVRRSGLVDDTIVATTLSETDDVVAAFCEREGFPCFRGSEEDVLDRYYRAALHVGADVVVRVTGDCPLIDPGVIDAVLSLYGEGGHDYVSNVVPPTFPDGLDVEVFSLRALELSSRNAKLRSEREHVSLYVRNHPELFGAACLRADVDRSDLRWTVDEPEDLEFVRTIYGELYAENPGFGYEDVVALLERRPEIASINKRVGRNEGLAKSIREDSVWRGEDDG